jgi:hypothetical protein
MITQSFRTQLHVTDFLGKGIKNRLKTYVGDTATTKNAMATLHGIFPSTVEKNKKQKFQCQRKNTYLVA